MANLSKKILRESITRLTIIIGKQLQMEKEDQLLMLMCLNTPRKIKVTSKNISPKAKKYGIIEPTNKVGDLDAVESICRR